MPGGSGKAGKPGGVLGVIRRAAVLLLAIAVCPAPVRAESPEQRIFTIDRLRLECELAQARLEREEELRKNGLASDVDVREARAALDRARIDLREALVAYQRDASAVILEKVVLSRNDTGQPVVRVTLGLARTPTSAHGTLERAWRLAGLDPASALVRGGVLSIWSGGALVGVPLTRWVEWPAGSRDVTADFLLQEETTRLTVRFEAGGSSREWTAPLLADASVAPVEISCPQPAQEAPLGASVRYPLEIRRRTGRAAAYSIVLDGAARHIRHSFLDGDSRISTVRFEAGKLSKDVILVLDLPERPTGDVVPDRELRFGVRLLSEESRPEGEREVARIDLALRPRGVGRIDFLADRTLLTADGTDPIDVQAELRNTGSGPLEDIVLEGSPPVGWRLEIDPPRIGKLDPDATKPVALRFVPRGTDLAGDYDFRVEVRAVSGGQPVQPLRQRFTITVHRQGSLAFVLLVLGGLALVLVVLGWLATRLARRGA